MIITYLLEIIKVLQPNQRQEMALFLSSPHFNRGKNAQDLISLYQIIMDAAPDFSEGVLNKDWLCSQVFSEPIKVPGRLEKLISDLSKLLRSYALTQLYFSESNDDQQQIDWAKWLRTHGLTEASRKTMVKLKSKKERERFESLELYHADLLIAEEEHQWEGTHNVLKGDLGIPAVIYHLDLYYFNYRTELENRYLLQQKGPQLPDLAWTNVGMDFWQKESVLLQIAKSINDILNKGLPSSEGFQDLMHLLLSKEDVLSFKTIAQLYAYLRNYCTLLINGGDLKFIPILHEIHKDNLKRNYFLINGEISPNVYVNIVQVATRAKEYDWAKGFTEEYRQSIIGGDEGRFFYHFNMVHCLFAERRFEEALDHIPDAPSNSHYHHMVRRLELKIYYELNSDLLLYKMDAFRKFIVRTATKTIAANLRMMDLNFLNILMQLTQTPMKDKTRSARLISRIEAKKLLADRAWLLEKARERG